LKKPSKTTNGQSTGCLILSQRCSAFSAVLAGPKSRVMMNILAQILISLDYQFFLSTLLIQPLGLFFPPVHGLTPEAGCYRPLAGAGLVPGFRPGGLPPGRKRLFQRSASLCNTPGQAGV
jgi:hypothetical protein